MHVRQADTLVTPLRGADVPRRGRETREAIEARRGEVVAFLGDKETSQLALVEIEPKKRFTKRTSDPKFAVRLGCADAGRVSQFITPVPVAEGGRMGKKKDVAKDLAYRAEAAWADGLRQMGLSFVPEHSIKGDAIPSRLNQVAFWVVRRNVSAQFSALESLIAGRFEVLAPVRSGAMGEVVKARDHAPGEGQVSNIVAVKRILCRRDGAPLSVSVGDELVQRFARVNRAGGSEIHDRDPLFTAAFGVVFRAGGTADNHHLAEDAAGECHPRARHRDPARVISGPS